MRTVGNDHLFRLTASVLQSMNKDIFTFENMATLVEYFEYEDWEQKILHNFLDGELIKAIPSGYKKRLVVYKWLANNFEYDRTYQEVKVYEIIQYYFPDYATLRRDMVILALCNVKRAFISESNGVCQHFPETKHPTHRVHFKPHTKI
jgi:hypothetical protein